MTKRISIFKTLFVVVVTLLLGGCAPKAMNPRDVPGYTVVDASSATNYPALAKWLNPISGKFLSDTGSTRPATIVVTEILPGGKQAKLTYSYGNVSYDSKGKPKMNGDGKILPDIIGTFVDENTLEFKFGSRSKITCRWQSNGDIKVSYAGSGIADGIFHIVNKAGDSVAKK